MKMNITKEFNIRFEVINYKCSEGSYSEDILKSFSSLEEAINYRETYLSDPLRTHLNIEIRVEYTISLVERK